MSSVKTEEIDLDELEVYYGSRICDRLKNDFKALEEHENLESLRIKLYIKQTEMTFITKILFKGNVPYPLRGIAKVNFDK